MSLGILSYVAWGYYYQYSGNAEADYYKERTITKAEAIKRINNCEVESVNKGNEYGPSHITPVKDRDISWQWYESYVNENDLADIDAAAQKNSDRCGNINNSVATSGELQYKALTVSEAKTILQSCKIIGFYFPGSSVERDSQEAATALEKTGIVLVSYADGKPLRMHIAEKARSEMTPIAKSAHDTCGNLQFWDGGYE